jgi:hypothetical protein
MCGWLQFACVYQAAHAWASYSRVLLPKYRSSVHASLSSRSDSQDATMESSRSQDPALSTSTHYRGIRNGSRPLGKCIRSPPTSALAELWSNGKHSRARHHEYVLQVCRRYTRSCTSGSCWYGGRMHRNMPQSHL